jgi:hypothetical protein
MSWPVPSAWLYGWIDTTVPGYRLASDGANNRQVADGYYMAPLLLDAVDDLPGYAVGVEGNGRIGVTAGDVITWDDRLGWALGMDAEPGDTDAATVSARVPSPVMIPLMSATVSRVDRETDRRFEIDKYLRGHSSIWGSADVWRWSLTVHRSAKESLDAGWMRAGQITISCSTPAEHIAGTPTAWSASNPGGYRTGQALGYRGDWVDQTTKQAWRCDFIMLTAATVPTAPLRANP